MVSDLLEEKEEFLREAEQLKQSIADLEKEVIVWKKASENNSYRALLSEDKYNKQKEINQELVEENESLKTQIKKMECLSEKRIAELEKENAELKSKNCWKTCEYAEPKSQWISQHIQDVEQLAKAKKLIKKLVHEFYYLCELHNFATDYECLAEAGRFLNSEVLDDK